MDVVAREVSALRTKLRDLSTTEHPLPPAIPSVDVGSRTDVVTNLRLMGIFPTARWEDDPTMPGFAEYHEFRIGFYRVAECDVKDAEGTASRLVLVVNQGDGDCNSGYWGGVFLPGDGVEEDGSGDGWQAVARIASVGDTETEVSGNMPGFVQYETSGDGALAFPEYKESEYGDDEEDEEDDDREKYFSGLSPGFCRTQFEKVIGLTMERMMRARGEWDELPKDLKDFGDIV